MSMQILSEQKSSEKNANFIIIFTTTPTPEDAEKIGSELVNLKLAACVSIINNVKSFYRWEGKVEKATENILLVKTRKELFDKVANQVRRLHPYELPEIIAVQIVTGSEQYLRWLGESAFPVEEEQK
ncbi:MAG: divalent-cation tolerance protein CutA [Candidatus Bathyarchaeota archaeon]